MGSSVAGFGELRGRGIDGNVSLAAINKADPSGFKVLVEELKVLGGDFFGEVQKDLSISSRRYMSDVILYENDQEISQLVGILHRHGEARGNGLFGFSVESNHVHVIHDCAYSNSSCRCSWKREVSAQFNIRPKRKYNKPFFEIAFTDWCDIFVYFFVAKRGRREIFYRGEALPVPSIDDIVRWGKRFERSVKLVQLQASAQSLDYGGRVRNKRDSCVDAQADAESHGKRRKTGTTVYTSIKEKTKQLLMKYYPCPSSYIKNIREFREDDLMTNPRHNQYVDAALQSFSMDLINYKLRDFEKMLMQEVSPVFYTSMEYGDIEESMLWVDELLKFQFNGEEDKIKEFLQTLVNVLDRKIPKLNALCIYSQPSAGKNFFFDMIFAICCNYGQLGQANKNNLFAFQEAPNKRIIWWNEPNYERAMTDTIKLLFGGDPCTVRVKHMSDQHVQRTPVIILTNNLVPFMNDIAFNERMKQYNWKPAPFLQFIDKKPYPLVFYDLLNKYEITY